MGVHEIRRAFWPTVALGAIVLALLVSLFRLGVVPTTWSGHDIPNHMDFAWRILQGQVPGRDFVAISYMGFHGLLALAMKLGQPGVGAYPWVQAVFVAFAALSAWILSESRGTRGEGLILGTLVSVLLAGPYLLGFGYGDLSYTCYYNKLGWAVASLVLYASFRRPSEPLRGWRLGAEVIFFGVIAAWIPLLKLTVFAVCGLAMLFGAWSGRISRKVVSPSLVLSFAIWVLLRLVADWNVFGIVWDQLSRMQAIQDPGATRIRYYNIAATGIPALAISLLCLRRWTAAQGAILVFGFLAAGLILYGNTETAELPLLAVLPLLIAPDERRGGLGTCLLGALAAAIALPWGYQSIRSLIEAGHIERRIARGQIVVDPKKQMIDSPFYQGWWVLKAGFNCDPMEYALRINDGLELLRANGAATKRIFALDFSDPFPAALGAPSPRGRNLNVDQGYRFYLKPDLQIAAPADYFGDTEAVMEPKCPVLTNSDEPLHQRFDAYIDEHFPRKAESRFWILRY